MAYSRAPVVVNLTDTIEEMRAEVNALTAKLNELFDGANFVTGIVGPSLITSPVLSGSVTGTYTFTTPTITNPTINAATLTGTIAADGTTITGAINLTGAVLAGATPLVFEGATADVYELTLAVADIASFNKTITLPDANGTVSLVSLAETLVNKTLTAPTINNGTATGITLTNVVNTSTVASHTGIPENDNSGKISSTYYADRVGDSALAMSVALGG
jgi:hypothetical protein